MVLKCNLSTRTDITGIDDDNQPAVLTESCFARIVLFGCYVAFHDVGDIVTVTA